MYSMGVGFGFAFRFSELLPPHVWYLSTAADAKLAPGGSRKGVLEGCLGAPSCGWRGWGGVVMG